MAFGSTRWTNADSLDAADNLPTNIGHFVWAGFINF
jgi:hypothetical protein